MVSTDIGCVNHMPAHKRGGQEDNVGRDVEKFSKWLHRRGEGFRLHASSCRQTS